MPMLQIDGTDIAQIDPTLASVLRHFVLRAGLGEGGGVPQVKTETVQPESALQRWRTVMGATNARVTVALQFKDVNERVAQVIAASAGAHERPPRAA